MKQHNKKHSVGTPASKTVKGVEKTVIETDSDIVINDKNLYLALLIIASLIVYAFGFNNQFLLWDDHVYVTQNPWIQNPTKNFMKLFTTVVAGNYHPLTMLTLALNIILFGKGPMSFIIVNTLIHTANTYLVFVFIGKLLKLNTESISNKKQFFIAFFTALFFGIHPMHVESVIWISERKDVLYTFFFLLALNKYCDFLQNSVFKNLALVFLFFVLSCLSKGMAVVLPLVLILIDYWSGKELVSVANLKNKIPFLLFSLFFGILTLNVQGKGTFFGLLNNDAGINSINSGYDLFDKLKFAGFGISIYVIKLFLPFNLHHFYPYPFMTNETYSEYYWGLFLTLIFIGFWVLSYYRNNRIIVFGIGFFLINLLLVLQFVTIGFTVLAERYTYIAYIGLIFILIYYALSKTKLRSITPLIIISVAFMTISVLYIKTWKNTLAIWENTYKKGERNFTVLINLADQYKDSNKWDDMQKVCQEAVSINLQSPKFNEYLGNYYVMNKDYSKAQEFYDKAIKTPNFSKEGERFELKNIYLNKGLTFRLMGDFPNAINSFNQALQYADKSNTTEILKNKASVLILEKQFKEAVNIFDNIINQGGANDSTYNDRAVAKFNLGDRASALEDLKKAVVLNPNNADAQRNLKILK